MQNGDAHFVSVLTAENPAARDGELFLLEETHTYWCAGKRVRQSVTQLLKRYFPAFDAEVVVEANYAKWKRDKSSKYNLLISYLVDVEKRDDAHCKRAICDIWAATGARASAEGTAMHRDFQCIAERLPPPQGETKEVRMFRKWLQNFCDTYDLAPWRAEWNIYYATPSGAALVAGQVDLVLKHREREEYWCVDFKRKDPRPKRAGGPPQLLGDELVNAFTEYGTGPFYEVPATDFGKYCCQQNVYAHIAAEQYGVDFRDRMYLLQVHEDMDAPHVVGVERMDDVARALFALLLREDGASAA